MAGPIRIAILANGRQARAEIERTAASADLLGRSVSRAGKLVAAGFAIDRLARGAAAIVTTGGAYVETLNKIRAITGTTQNQIDRGASSLEGQSSQYAKMGETTGDAATGVLELAKAGLNLKKSLAAVYPTLVLAKSGQLEVADASELVANTLNTFDLKAKDSARIANSIANAADISSANVTDLAEAFKYVSPLAAKSGVSLEQTNAVLAELANSGIKASLAGTGFRKFLASLQAPVGKAADTIDSLGLQIYDSTGRMRPLVDLIFDLKKGLSNLDEEGQNRALRNIFGLTGITAAQVILKQGADGLGRYTEGVERADGAARLANASSKGLLGTLRSLKSGAISGADALYRQYSPAVDKALRQLVGDAKQELPDAIAAAKKAAHELEPTLESLAQLAQDLGGDVHDLASGPLGKEFVDALKLTVQLTKTAADVLDGLPDPIRKIGIEVGIAALLLPKFSNGVTNMVSSATSSLAQLRAEVSVTKSVTQEWALTTASLTSKDRIPDLSGVVTPQVAALQQQYKGLKLTQEQVRTSSVSSKLALEKLGGAAKQAAGVGGVLALANASGETNKKLGLLEGAAGGALLGFSVGGPWGAAIGGGAGALLTLATNTKKSGSALDDARQPAVDFASSLNEVSGAATQATRQLVYQTLATQGVLTSASALGVSARTVVSAVLGQKGAVQEVNRAIQDNVSVTGAYVDAFGQIQVSSGANTDAALKLKGAVAGTTEQLAGQIAKTREAALATGNLTKILKGVPGEVRTRLSSDADITRRDVARLTAQYKLTPKQVTTILRATNVNATVAQVQRLADKLTAAGKIKIEPDLKGGVDKAVSGAKGSATKGGQSLVDILEQHLAKTKASMPQLSPSVRQATDGAKGPASAGGQGIGTSVKQGFGSGFAGAALAWSAQLAAAVRAAIAAGRAAAKAHSPSEETARLGQDLADGLAVGMARKKHKTHDAGRDMITAALAGIIGGTASGSDDISSALDALSDRLDKGLDKTLKQIQGKFDRKEKKLRASLSGAAETKAVHANDKAERLAEQAAKKQRKAINQLTKQYRDQLRAVGAQQDVVNQQLEDAKGNLQSLVDSAQEYADSIRDAVVASGSLSTLGQGEGFSSIDDLIAKRTAKVADAKKFADDINALIAAGLNANDIKDLLAQGVEGGLGTAEALLAAGPQAVAKMNALSAQLQATGVTLGANVSTSLYGAGIQAAQGLVDGLTAQSDALAASATKLAKALVRAVKKALGIASPSRVFREIGQNTVLGLGLGLDNVYVKRQGQSLANDLQLGFGTPALAAYVGSGGGSAGSTTVQISVAVPPTADKVAIGKEVQSALDAYYAVGGRQRS